VTDGAKENPSKTQSKEWFAQSLLTLMQIKPFYSISITEIAEQAQLARRTFYRHFNVQTDILEYLIQKLCVKYIDLLLEQSDLSFSNIALVFFNFCEANKDFLFIMHKNDLLFYLLQKFNQYLPEIQLRVLGSKSLAEDRYSIYFSAGGFWNLLIKWLDDGAQESPLKMAKIAGSIIHHFD